MAIDPTVRAIETASVDALRAHQLGRLRETIGRLDAGVPRYRDKLDAAGVRPDDLTSLDDLARLPFTTKEDLRAKYPFGLFAVPMAEVVRVHASSGTTGKPTVVGHTAGDIACWAGILAHSLAAVGATSRDKVHIAFGYGLFTGGLGWHYGVPRAEGVRAEIEASLGVDAYDTYGLSEIIGPGVAHECVGDKGALTIREDHFYPEIIDPETGTVLPEGEKGELVLTTLTKERMPMIRYRTRDLTRLLPPAQGSLRRMERVAGRSDDMRIIRGVNIFPSQIEDILTLEPRLAPAHVLEVRRGQRHLDELRVGVEARNGAAGDDAAEIGRHAERLIKAHAGVTVAVAVVAPGTIERLPGEAKRVIDLRPKD